jgi:hypothetical protein
MATPTSTQTYTTNIPEELLPYERTLLDTAAGYTDLTKNPFQQYQGERVAQASPLMQQAEDTASQMGVAGQVGAGTTLAGAVGTEALNPYSFTDTGVAQQYMSPYMQNVTDVQQQQAKRQADIAAQQQQAQAANYGAFGGGRDAIMRSQGNAELQRNLAGIQATGLQNAYQQGAQQYNAEQGQRMQGLQMANTAAGTLGNLGQEQYNQTSGIVGLQGQLGQLEGQRAQQGLDTQYQDFLNYQNYPFKTMGFMSDILRGTPTTTSASSIYQAPPSATQSLMSLGLGAYGLNSLFGGTGTTGTGKAAGGTVNSYANGGAIRFDDGGDVPATPAPIYRTADEVYRNVLGRAPESAEAAAAWDNYFGGNVDIPKMQTFLHAATPELQATGYKPAIEGFNPTAYLAANKDVADAYGVETYGLTPEQFAAQHYNMFGKNEGRQGVPHPIEPAGWTGYGDGFQSQAEVEAAREAAVRATQLSPNPGNYQSVGIAEARPPAPVYYTPPEQQPIIERPEPVQQTYIDPFAQAQYEALLQRPAESVDPAQLDYFRRAALGQLKAKGPQANPALYGPPKPADYGPPGPGVPVSKLADQVSTPTATPYQKYAVPGSGSNQDLNKLINAGIGAAASHFIPGYDYVSGARNLISGNLPGAAKDFISGITGGISNLFANGGAVRYDGGGSVEGSNSVMSPEFKRYAVGHIDPRQLPLAQRNAQARGDLDTRQFAMQQMADDAAVRRGGIAPALPAGTDVVRAAGGGILAFAAGGNKGQMTPESLIQQSIDAAKYTPTDTATRIANINAARPGIAAAYGESETDPMVKEDIARRQAAIDAMPSQLNGLTLLRMAAALQKSGVTDDDRMAGMFGAAAEGGEKAMAARNAAESELSKAKFAGAAARQARRDGFTDKASALDQQETAHMREAKKLESTAAVHGASTLGHIKSSNIAASSRAKSNSDLDRKAFYKGQEKARDLASREATKLWENIYDRKKLEKQGITDYDQLYQQRLKRHVKNAIPIYGVTPDSEED